MDSRLRWGILFTSRCCFNSIYLKWFLMWQWYFFWGERDHFRYLWLSIILPLSDWILITTTVHNSISRPLHSVCLHAQLNIRFWRLLRHLFCSCNWESGITDRNVSSTPGGDKSFLHVTSHFYRRRLTSHNNKQLELDATSVLCPY